MGQICKSVKLDQQLSQIETIQCSVPNDEGDFCKPDNLHKFNKFLEQRHRNSNSTIDPLINGNISDFTIDQENQQFRIEEQVMVIKIYVYTIQVSTLHSLLITSCFLNFLLIISYFLQFIKYFVSQIKYLFEYIPQIINIFELAQVRFNMETNNQKQEEISNYQYYKLNEKKEYRYQIPENSKSCIKSNNKDLKSNLKSKKKVSFNDFEFYNFSINPKFSSSSQEMI